MWSVTKRIQKPKKTELKFDWESKRRSEKEGDEEGRRETMEVRSTRVSAALQHAAETKEKKRCACVVSHVP